MSNIFKSRVFKIVSISFLSLLLCFSFMFTNLNNNKLKASANDINSTDSVLVLPSVYLDFRYESTSDYILPSIYFSYDFNGIPSSNTNVCYYPIVNNGYLDYSSITNHTEGSSTLFSISNLCGIDVKRNGTANLVVSNMVDTVYIDYSPSVSLEELLEDNNTFIAIQRYNQYISGVEYGHINFLVLTNQGNYDSLLFLLRIERLPPILNVDSSYVPISEVVSINTVNINSQTLIERAENDGYIRGLREGGGKGFQDGYDLGKQEGEDIGFQKGYDKAIEDTSKGGIFSSILSAVDGFMGTNIFGNFSIGDIVSLAFGFILFGLFIKVFLGG